MNFLKAISKLFGSPDNSTSEANSRWIRGYSAFQKGEELYINNHVQQALEYFDQAIADGFTDTEVYTSRGSCLQLLNFDLDAIDDFTKAIARETKDCNLFYMRSVSRDAVGDFRGRVGDLQETIRLAGVPSRLNDAYNEAAQEQGWNQNVQRYMMELETANRQLEMQEMIERRLKDNPDIPITDLASRKRANCKRRSLNQ